MADNSSGFISLFLVDANLLVLFISAKSDWRKCSFGCFNIGFESNTKNLLLPGYRFFKPGNEWP
jgi:hypothetical protein